MYRRISKSKITQRVGSRAQVMHGNAKMTGGGLKKKDLKYNKQGKIVSKKMSSMAKKDKRLQKAGWVTKKGQFGAVRSMNGGVGDDILGNYLRKNASAINSPKFTAPGYGERGIFKDITFQRPANRNKVLSAISTHNAYKRDNAILKLSTYATWGEYLINCMKTDTKLDLKINPSLTIAEYKQKVNVHLNKPNFGPKWFDLGGKDWNKLIQPKINNSTLKYNKIVAPNNIKLSSLIPPIITGGTLPDRQEKIENFKRASKAAAAAEAPSAPPAAEQEIYYITPENEGLFTCKSVEPLLDTFNKETLYKDTKLNPYHGVLAIGSTDTHIGRYDGGGIWEHFNTKKIDAKQIFGTDLDKVKISKPTLESNDEKSKRDIQQVLNNIDDTSGVLVLGGKALFTGVGANNPKNTYKLFTQREIISLLDETRRDNVAKVDKIVREQKLDKIAALKIVDPQGVNPITSFLYYLIKDYKNIVFCIGSRK